MWRNDKEGDLIQYNLLKTNLGHKRKDNVNICLSCDYNLCSFQIKVLLKAMIKMAKWV